MKSGVIRHYVASRQNRVALVVFEGREKNVSHLLYTDSGGEDRCGRVPET